MKNISTLLRLFALCTTAIAVLMVSPDVQALCPDNQFDDEIVNEHPSVGHPIYTRFFNLDPNETYSWRMHNLTAGSESIMRLFRMDVSLTQGYTESATEVANGFTGSGGTAESEITNFSPDTSGTYLLVVHSPYSFLDGIGDLSFNGGAIVYLNVAFGGRMNYTCRLKDGEKVHTVYEPAPDGADRHQLLVANSVYSDGYFFGGDSNGRRGVDYTHQGASTNQYNVAYVASYNAYSGAISHVWNDANDDDDGDGLGNLLEESIGTCPNHNYGTYTNSGWPCWTYDSRDTDGDGLSDYEELFGVTEHKCTSFPYFTCYYESTPLRWWGADPLHKDVFVEVDYEEGVLASGENVLFDNRKLNWAQNYQGFFLAGSASEVGNPSGLNGIHLHLDVEGTDNGGLASGNNPVLMFDSGESEQLDEDACKGKEYRDRRTDSQRSQRHRLFHYQCMRPSWGGGQEWKLAFRSGRSSRISAHELGHSLLLGHGGFEHLNGKPNYYSLMNYAFQNTAPGFSLDVMAPLNPTSLCETAGVGSPNTSTHLEGAHGFSVAADDVGVDWNRDGVFSSCSVPVSGSINWTGAGNHAHTQATAEIHQMTNADPLGRAAAARIDVAGLERVYVFWGHPNAHDPFPYEMSGKFNSFPGDCLRANPVEDGCFGAVWQDFNADLGRARHVAAATLEDSQANPHIYLAVAYDGYNGSAGGVRVLKATPLADPFNPTPDLDVTIVFDTSDDVYLTGDASGPPAIEVHDGKLHVVWQESSTNEIWHTEMNTLEYWSPAAPVTDPNSSVLTSAAPPALATNPHADTLQLLRTNPSSSHLELFRQTTASDWVPDSDISIPAVDAHITPAKPSLAWKGFDSPDGPGFWQIAFERPQDEHPHDRPWRMLYVGRDLNNNVFHKIGNFAHKWNHSSHVQLMRTPGDASLHAARVIAEKLDTGDFRSTVEFVPYADGIYDYDLKDNNDFFSMSYGACEVFNREFPNDSRPCGMPGSIGNPVLPEGEHFCGDGDE